MIPRQRSAGTWANLASRERAVRERVRRRCRSGAARVAPTKKAMQRIGLPRVHLRPLTNGQPRPDRELTNERRRLGDHHVADQHVGASVPMSPGSPSPWRMPTVDALTIMSTPRGTAVAASHVSRRERPREAS